DDGVPHARLADRPREVRLPDPLGEPEALGGGAKLRGARPGEPLDLAALVRIRDGGADRFGVAAGEDLVLPAGGQGPDPRAGAGPKVRGIACASASRNISRPAGVRGI